MTIRTLSHAALEILSRTTDDIMIVMDQDHHVCLFNAAAVSAFDIPAADMIGQPLEAYDATRELLSLYQQAINPGEIVSGQITVANGALHNVHIVFAPALDPKTRLPVMMKEIVHELKTPISAALGFMNLVEMTGALTEKQTTFIQRAQRNMDSMLGLVYELLDMAWLEADGQLNLIATDLNEIVDYAIKLLGGYAQRSRISLDVQPTPQACLVRADERRLASAVMNLVSNAIKYSPNGGTVIITVTCQDHKLEVRVKDHGMGIPAEYLPHIWDPFYRINIPETRRIEGSGLGLGIVKAVVEKHGGEVFVRSTPGEGSLFGFRLPAGSD